MSMASGEYVSVSSQSDTEEADLRREKTELAAQPAACATAGRLTGVMTREAFSDSL
jgi:VIT1/CCC1 family predicted Fe2+/Mn2+ transporter